MSKRVQTSSRVSSAASLSSQMPRACKTPQCRRSPSLFLDNFDADPCETRCLNVSPWYVIFGRCSVASSTARPAFSHHPYLVYLFDLLLLISHKDSGPLVEAALALNPGQHEAFAPSKRTASYAQKSSAGSIRVLMSWHPAQSGFSNPLPEMT